MKSRGNSLLAGMVGGASIVAIAFVPFVGGCGNGRMAQAVTPNDGHDTAQLARCSVAASHDEPLVTEWPASYKARLEAQLLQGAVAVEYSGCDLRIVDTCRIAGTYAWSKTTLSTDTTEIHDEDELYAKLPIGAATLAGQLQTSGSLSVQTTVVGQMRLVGGLTNDATNGADCARATHIVTGLSIGAFKLMSGGEATGSGTASVGLASAGGSAKQTKSVLRTAGDPSSCPHATKDGPTDDCRSPIQIFLAPIRRSVPLNVLSPIPDEPG